MYTITLLAVHERTAPLRSELTRLWEASVRATHDFLSEADIVELRPLVDQALGGIATLALAHTANGHVCAFIGVQEGKIEMLFVAPEYRGQGVGKKCIEYARAIHDATMVDVNEQNPKALGFYQRMGFSVTSRSECDEQGRPFPILHLRSRE